MKILELFGGIGACTSALKRLNIDFEIADYVEIDKYAVASYNAINGTHFETQDIRNWNKDIQVDLIMHGSPCQDFSLAGYGKGGDEGSGTRSSLMYETIRIVNNLKPKYVIWENVKNLISKKHKHNFDRYLQALSEGGYRNYWQVLNAKDYGIPQNRERVFTISIRNDIDKDFEFPQKQKLELKLKDMLEDRVDEKYFLENEKIEKISHWKSFQKPFEKVNGNNSIVQTLTARGAGEEHSGMITYSELLDETSNMQDRCLNIKNATKKGFDKAIEGDSIDLTYPNSTTRRGRVGHQVSQTITATNQDLRIRKLTPKECWRLMGFTDEEFEKASQVNSNTQLYKQARKLNSCKCAGRNIKELIEVR